MRRFLRHNTVEFVWMLSIVLATGIISVIWVDIFEDAKSTCSTIEERIKPYDIVITAILLLYVIIFLFIRKNYVLKEIFEKSFWENLFRWSNLKLILLPALIIIFMGFVIWYLKSDEGKHFFINPGGVFTLVMGFATATGTYLAIKSIVEMKHTITSYPQLIESITKLIADTPSKEIRIVSYFILPGYWQVVSESRRKSFEDALETASNKIKIACLTPEENLSIVIDVAKKGTPLYPDGANANDIIGFQNKCESILSMFEKPKRLKWEKLPYYFFFVTNERAVIVTPVGLPKINKSILNQITGRLNDSKENLLNHINYILSTLHYNRSKRREAKVDTLGFETSDQRIIETLWGLFDEYYFENGVDIEPQNGELTKESTIPPSPLPPSNSENMNVEVNKYQGAADVLVEIYDKIKVRVNVKE
jgi:hypothetical protein